VLSSPPPLWFCRWWQLGENCTGPVTKQAGSNPTGSLELENLVGVFIVLGVTVVLAIMVEIGKKIYLAVQSRRENRQHEVCESMFVVKILFVRAFTIEIRIQNKLYDNAISLYDFVLIE